MTARFAGSRSIDERRRRRLAVAPAEPPRVDGSIDPEVLERAAARILHFPLRKLVSDRAWKLFAVSFISFLAVAGSIFLTFVAIAAPTRLDLEVLLLFQPGTGRFVTVFAAAMCFLAAQFAWLTWWMRSQSLNDFEGRYRVWLRAAVLLFGTAFCIATDVHTLASSILCRYLALDFPYQETLCWLTPLSIPAIVVFRGLLRDMRGCRVSRSMLWLAATLAVAAGGVRLFGHRLPTHPLLPQSVVIAGCVLAAAWAAMIGVLSHARYVMHFCAEAPLVGDGMMQRLWRRLRSSRAEHGDAEDGDAAKPKRSRKVRVDAAGTDAPAPTKRSRKAASKLAPRKSKSTEPIVKVPANAESAESATPAPVKVTAESKTTTQPPARQEPQSAAPPKPSVPTPPPKREENRPTVSPPQPQSPPPTVSKQTDSAPDDSDREETPSLDRDALKGLSKRQRRELRKQVKEEQRQSRAA